METINTNRTDFLEKGSAIAAAFYVASVVVFSYNTKLYAYSNFAFVALVAIFVLATFKRPVAYFPKGLLILLFLTAYFTFNTIMFSKVSNVSFAAVKTLFKLSVMVFVIVNICIRCRSILPVISGYVMGGLIASFTAFTTIKPDNVLRMRISGIVENANSFGDILVIGICFCLCLISRFSDKKARYAIVVLIGIFSYMIVYYSGSRQATVGLGIVFFIISMLKISELKHRSMFTKVFYLSVVGLLLYYGIQALFMSPHFHKFQNIKLLMSGQILDLDNSTFTRRMMLKSALDMWSSAPLTGSGLHYFASHFSKTAYSHSNLLELLVSGGIIACLIWYYCIWNILSSFVSIAKTKKFPSATMHIHWRSTAIAFILFLEIAYVSFLDKSVWILLGTIIASCHLDLEQIRMQSVENRVGVENTFQIATQQNISMRSMPHG